MTNEHGSNSRENENFSSSKKTSREAAIMNVIINTSVILMSAMMDAFGEFIVQTTGAMAAGMANAMDEKELGEEITNEVKTKSPEINEEMKTLISEVHNGIYLQYTQKQKEIQPLLADKIFDNGPQIVEKYDFNLPKLNKKVDDKILAQYTLLLAIEDENFAKMFEELTAWMNTLPNFPVKTD